MKRICLLLLCCLLAGSRLTAAVPAGKPFVVPELKEWKPASGVLALTPGFRIAVPADDPELQRIAGLLAADWAAMFGHTPEVTEASGRRGDLILERLAGRKHSPGRSPDGQLGPEGYRIRITDRIRIAAPEPAGLYWGTRTLLQLADRDSLRRIPRGEIRDWPDYAVRGFMLDCGRKFIPMHFLDDLVRTMAYYKMNTLQIHLNDNGFKQFFGHDWDRTYAAFRLECDTWPELTARDGSYSKQEFIRLQEEAADRFVEIIPEIDIPAHTLALTRCRPEIGSREYGMDHLDLFHPATYEFVDALLREYLEDRDGEGPVFRGPRVHIGTDEYANRDTAVVERFRYFTDRYIRYVESFGKQAVIWGALTHAAGRTPVKSENVIMSAWYNGYADPETMIREGYRLISIPDGLVYIVPAAGYYYDYLNEPYLYREWTPAHIGKAVFEERHPAILGGMFALWNDHVGNGISLGDIHHRIFPALQTLSVKMWTGARTALPYEAFDSLRRTVREAPGINRAGRIGDRPGCVLTRDTLTPGERLPYGHIGYGYTVRFRIEAAEETPGTELFRSQDAVFYLSDPIRGMFGFARDGYLNTFRYRPRPGEQADIEIRGDAVSTSLYVNGRLVDRLEIRPVWYDGGKARMNYVPTLVFPLQQAGTFSSRITNLEIYNYLR